MYEIRGKEGGAGFIKEQGLKNVKLWTGSMKEGSSLERTKVVKVSTLTFTSVHVGIEVQRKI